MLKEHGWNVIAVVKTHQLQPTETVTTTPSVAGDKEKSVEIEPVACRLPVSTGGGGTPVVAVAAMKVADPSTGDGRDQVTVRGDRQDGNATSSVLCKSHFEFL